MHGLATANRHLLDAIRDGFWETGGDRVHRLAAFGWPAAALRHRASRSRSSVCASLNQSARASALTTRNDVAG